MSTEMMVPQFTPIKDASDIIAELTGDTQVSFTTLNGDTFEDKKRLYNAINSPDERLKAHINEAINMVDVHVSVVELESDDGSGSDNVPRVIIFDDKGKSYVATSSGVYNSLQKIYMLFGTLHFDKGLPVVPKEIPTKRGSTLTLAIK